MRCIWLLLSLFIAGCYSPSASVYTSPASRSQPAANHKQSLKAVSKQKTVTKAAKPKKLAKSDIQDSAPPGPAPTFFEKVKPISQPFSRYGNPDTYTVNGHVYQVLRTAKGYKSRGVASWYGTKFHSQRTSSGDDYNMYSMTAAHKTLPLPTYVRVRNLINGKEAIVKVNDRGPFHDDRIIDLSYAAATKLGIFPKGTAPVEIEAISGPAKQFGQYYVQAGAFNTKQLAQVLCDKLAKLSKSPAFIEKYQHRFIVKLGPFANKAVSDSIKMQLAKSGVPGAFSILQ